MTSRLSSDSKVVLEYVATHTELGSYATGPELAGATNFDVERVVKAVYELQSRGIVSLQVSGETADPAYDFDEIYPEARAWLRVDRELLGFDPRQDMIKVAQRVLEQKRVDEPTLTATTELSANRTNIAAAALEAAAAIELVREDVLGEFFSEAQANSYTSQWLKANQ